MKRGRPVAASVTLLDFFNRAPKLCVLEAAPSVSHVALQSSAKVVAPTAPVVLPTLPFSDTSALEKHGRTTGDPTAASRSDSGVAEDADFGEIGLEEALEMIIEAHSPKAQVLTMRLQSEDPPETPVKIDCPFNAKLVVPAAMGAASSSIVTSCGTAKPSGESMDAASLHGVAPNVPGAGAFGDSSLRVLTLIWDFSGPRRCCAIRQASRSIARLCPVNRPALKRELETWALTAVDASAMQPAAAWAAKAAGGDDAPLGAGARLGRWGDFTVLTDGAGRHFVRGPALLRCTQRWRLRARTARLSSLPQPWDEEADMPLREALRRSTAAEIAAEGEGSGRVASVHSTASVWDAQSGRPLKRPKKSNDVSPKGGLGSPTGSAGAVPEGSAYSSADACGLFSMKRWDALMDPRVPWRLRSAALIYHHHCVRGCPHAGARDAAAAYIRTHTRHDERLRIALLDQGGI